MGEYADSLKKKNSTKASEAVEAAREAAAKAAKAAKEKAAAAKAQEKRDAARSAGRNSPVSSSNPSPSPSPSPTPSPSPDKTPISRGGGPSDTVSVGMRDEEIFEVPRPIMDPTPEPIFTIMPVPETVVRTPTRNVTDISSLVPQFNAEQIQKILFENLSAIELSRVERHDTIEGINQRYSIISNLSEIRKKYDMTKQLTIMDKFKPLTSIYTINIQDKIPQEDYILLENLNATYQYLDENNQIVTREKGYYYFDTNGDLVIELINLERNQQVEVLIDTNGTIYKVES
jgi:hypothetical protein